MSERPFITSLRTDKNVMRYNINGRIYEFIVTKIDNDVPYGYCYKLHNYAWLYHDKVVAVGELPVDAVLIS
jgi:hypothetical protein